MERILAPPPPLSCFDSDSDSFGYEDQWDESELKKIRTGGKTDSAVDVWSLESSPSSATPASTTDLQFIRSLKDGDVDFVARMLEEDSGRADRILPSCPLVLNAGGDRPIFVACYTGCPEMVALLLKYQVDLRPDQWGMTPLMRTCGADYPGMMLVPGDHRQETAEFEDFQTRLLRVIQMLIQAGDSDVDATDCNLMTALMFASKQGHDQLVDHLVLQCGAKVGLSNVSGWTALHLAMDNGHGAVARRLLEAGADPNALNRDGLSPADVAHDCSPEVVQAFQTLSKLTPLRGRLQQPHPQQLEPRHQPQANSKEEGDVETAVRTLHKLDVALKQYLHLSQLDLESLHQLKGRSVLQVLKDPLTWPDGLVLLMANQSRMHQFSSAYLNFLLTELKDSSERMLHIGSQEDQDLDAVEVWLRHALSQSGANQRLLSDLSRRLSQLRSQTTRANQRASLWPLSSPWSWSVMLTMACFGIAFLKYKVAQPSP